MNICNRYKISDNDINAFIANLSCELPVLEQLLHGVGWTRKQRFAFAHPHGLLYGALPL